METFSEGQLNKFSKLIRVAARYIFSGDLHERLQELEAQKADNYGLDASQQPKKPRRKRVKEENLAIVVIDTLATWAQGWVSEERFAQKLQLSAKQVHRTLKALQRGGFVVLEERREKVNRDRVESVADYEEVAAKARTATYVSIDYPLMFDMLRLRLHLVKKQAADQIDDGNVMEQYACCSRDGRAPACGQKYDSLGMSYLDIDDAGFYKCSTCDFGIVAPDDELSRAEPDGTVRIRKARFRREGAKQAKEHLVKALAPLEAMVRELEGVDPPDFGSFTDWMQRRQELLQSGKATAAAHKSGGSYKGRLDFGIDGPIANAGDVTLDFGAAAAAPEAGQAIAVNAPPPSEAAAASLPYFIRNGVKDVAAAPAAEASTSAAAAAAPASQDEAARYLAYVQQFRAVMAARSGAGAAAVKEEDAAAVNEEDAAGGDVGSGAAKREREGGDADAEASASKRPKAEAEAGDEDIEWEEAEAVATGDAAADGAKGVQGDDDLEWEDA